jgi:hypothetical protein
MIQNGMLFCVLFEKVLLVFFIRLAMPHLLASGISKPIPATHLSVVLQVYNTSLVESTQTRVPV